MAPGRLKPILALAAALLAAGAVASCGGKGAPKEKPAPLVGAAAPVRHVFVDALEAIGTDMKGQRERLERDHAAVHDDFVGMFNELDKRVSWHRCVLTIVGCVALVGAALATMAYLMMTPRGSIACLLPG